VRGLIGYLVLALGVSISLWSVSDQAQENQRQSRVICRNQVYLQNKLARLVELAAPGQLKLGRPLVAAEFVRTARQLRGHRC